MSAAGAVLDLDGTVYHGDELVDGAVSGIDTLRNAGMEPVYFSNNPVRSGQEFETHLQEFGIDVGPGMACSSADVTIAHLQNHHGDDRILPITSPAFRERLRSDGFDVTDDPASSEVLVASWKQSFDFSDMRRALDAMSEETAFYGTDPDRTFQITGGKPIPGSGAIIGAVEATTGREPDAILGKPSTTSISYLEDRLGIDPSDCVIVGDRLDTDIRMGFRTGMTTVLVLSGVTDRADVQSSPIEPDYVIENLGAIDEVIPHL